MKDNKGQAMEAIDPRIIRLAEALTHLKARLRQGKLGFASEGEGALLLNIARHGGKLSFLQARKALSSVPSRVTALVKSLQEKGLVEKRQSEEDRRSRYLVLTDKGRDFVEEVKNEINDSIRDMFAKVGDDEVESFLSTLERIVS